MTKATYFIIASLFATGAGFSDEDLWESKGPHVRIKKNDQDGSYVVFERSPDDRRLVKTTKNENGEVKMKATYTRDNKGFLRYGQIHDGQGVLIYRVQYGYDNESGQLVAEQILSQDEVEALLSAIKNDDVQTSGKAAVEGSEDAVLISKFKMEVSNGFVWDMVIEGALWPDAARARARRRRFRVLKTGSFETSLNRHRWNPTR